MKLFALQFDIAWENPPENFLKVRRLLSQARPEPGSLIALPEMFATGFSMNARTIAEPADGGTAKFLSHTAAEYRISLVAGVAVQDDDGRVRNRALCFTPTGELAASYGKMRLFTPGGEGEHYAPGDRPAAFRCGDCTVSPFVCYDLRFPEIFRQAAADARPEIFVVIASWPSQRLLHWTRLLQARAIENQAYVVGVNRVGADPYFQYAGRSLVADFNGEIVADAGAGEGWAQFEPDLAGLRKYRAGLRFLDDLRAP
jgi:omega-amidase